MKILNEKEIVELYNSTYEEQVSDIESILDMA